MLIAMLYGSSIAWKKENAAKPMALSLVPYFPRWWACSWPDSCSCEMRVHSEMLLGSRDECRFPRWADLVRDTWAALKAAEEVEGQREGLSLAVARAREGRGVLEDIGAVVDDVGAVARVGFAEAMARRRGLLPPPERQTGATASGGLGGQGEQGKEVESHQRAMDNDALLDSSELSEELDFQREIFNKCMKAAIDNGTTFSEARAQLIRADARYQPHVGGSKAYAHLRICDVILDNTKLANNRSGGVKSMCDESRSKVLAGAELYLL